MQQKHNEGVINSVTQWIMNNLDQRLSIDDIAAKSGYSKWYLQKLFARYHNETLARYIRKKKLACCVSELKYTGLPIINLAVKYHFESQQSFTRSFKQVMGCTPLFCRKRKLDHEASQRLRASDDPCAICRQADFSRSEQQTAISLPAVHNTANARIRCTLR